MEEKNEMAYCRDGRTNRQTHRLVKVLVHCWCWESLYGPVRSVQWDGCIQEHTNAYCIYRGVLSKRKQTNILSIHQCLSLVCKILLQETCFDWGVNMDEVDTPHYMRLGVCPIVVLVIIKKLRFKTKGMILQEQMESIMWLERCFHMSSMWTENTETEGASASQRHSSTGGKSTDREQKVRPCGIIIVVQNIINNKKHTVVVIP